MTHPTPLPAVDADVVAIREALAAKPTPGPYRVITDYIPHMLGGHHIERRIFTTWDHPQLKGPTGVVNRSSAIGKKDGDPAVSLLSISEEDAEYIAACSPDRLERILTALSAAQARAEAVEKEAARYRWLRDSQESDWAICEWANDHDGTGFYRDARNADIVEAAIDAAMAADSAIGGKGA